LFDGHPGEGRDPGSKKNLFKTWIPAFAGMTNKRKFSGLPVKNFIAAGY
jgi:hypothetical protein